VGPGKNQKAQTVEKHLSQGSKDRWQNGQSSAKKEVPMLSDAYEKDNQFERPYLGLCGGGSLESLPVRQSKKQ